MNVTELPDTIRYTDMIDVKFSDGSIATNTYTNIFYWCVSNIIGYRLHKYTSELKLSKE